MTRAEVCAAAIADAFADDGEIFGQPDGPACRCSASRLAKLTSNPDLVISDGESLLLAGVPPLFAKADVVEGWIPFRRVFDVVAYGKRHVMMGATQIDRHGNQNISAIGDFAQPKRQLLGVARRAGQHRQQPDVLLGAQALAARLRRAGRRRLRRRAARAPRQPGRRRRRSTTSTASSPTSASSTSTGPTTRCGSSRVHPGVTVDEVAAATGFELACRRATSPETREPDRRRADADPRHARPEGPARPRGAREHVIEQLLRTPLTELAGVRHPVVQTGMGWVAGPRLVVGTANAGGLGILAARR